MFGTGFSRFNVRVVQYVQLLQIRLRKVGEGCLVEGRGVVSEGGNITIAPG